MQKILEKLTVKKPLSLLPSEGRGHEAWYLLVEVRVTQQPAAVFSRVTPPSIGASLMGPAGRPAELGLLGAGLHAAEDV
ncbi:hypothetical protein EYF80_060931 [Liparis tanakae]|uniref:Uncharacterized protein n=1 Tax=Liparis tanakae TaxID=230148 RepID=A0A4Z2EJV2_9TELE|nr:hypothetical protein EYF80_060931 [Liparis tanakae]